MDTLYVDIDNILWLDWDPIRVNDIGPRDEYTFYTKTVTDLKRSGADVETIANLLLHIEIQRMGLTGSYERCIAVAKKIYALPNNWA